MGREREREMDLFRPRQPKLLSKAEINTSHLILFTCVCRYAFSYSGQYFTCNKSTQQIANKH